MGVNLSPNVTEFQAILEISWGKGSCELASVGEKGIYF